MNLDEIKAALARGCRVFWKNRAYEVIAPQPGRYLIKCHTTRSCVALTDASGTTINGDEKDFYAIEPDNNAS